MVSRHQYFIQDKCRKGIYFTPRCLCVAGHRRGFVWVACAHLSPCSSPPTLVKGFF